MIARIARAALVAGALAGALAWAAHQWRAVPVIIQAEAYEHTAPSPAPQSAAAPSHPQTQPNGHDDKGEDEGWRRHARTFLSTIVTGIGYGFLLVGAIVLAGRPVDARAGALWGAGGFVAFAAAPALGLPPELPGMAAAELGPRQAWWLATVAASAGGIALIVFPRARLAKIAGAALMVLPHLVGAPKVPPAPAYLPAELAAEFAVVSLLSAAAFWVALGALSGYLLAKSESSPAEA